MRTDGLFEGESSQQLLIDSLFVLQSMVHGDRVIVLGEGYPLPQSQKYSALQVLKIILHRMDVNIIYRHKL